jgi:hypothetical protein
MRPLHTTVGWLAGGERRAEARGCMWGAAMTLGRTLNPRKARLMDEAEKEGDLADQQRLQAELISSAQAAQRASTALLPCPAAQLNLCCCSRV